MSLSDDSPRSFHILLNRGSGRNDADSTRATIAEVLTAAGCPHRFTLVEDPSRLDEMAVQVVQQAKQGGAVVVAAGGDGTISAIAQRVLGSGCVFGVLPQGTFNYFGRTHGISQETAEATRQLITGQAQPVQVGLVNDRVFLVNASLGLYPQVLEDREAYKQQFGRSRLVALGAALATLSGTRRQLRLRIEYRGTEHTLRTPTLFIGNNALQMAQIGLSEAKAIESGHLLGVALKPVGTLALLWLMVRGAMGRLGDADKVVDFAFRRIGVTVSTGARQQRRIKVAMDGEMHWFTGALDFRVSPESLMLIKPTAGDAP